MLANYERQKEAPHDGRKPRQVSAGVTVKELCNADLNHELAKKATVPLGAPADPPSTLAVKVTYSPRTEFVPSDDTVVVVCW